MTSPMSVNVEAAATAVPGGGLFGPLLLTEEILTEPLDYSEFEVAVPNGSGLGVTLDEDRVAFFARDGIRKTISLPGKA